MEPPVDDTAFSNSLDFNLKSNTAFGWVGQFEFYSPPLPLPSSDAPRRRQRSLPGVMVAAPFSPCKPGGGKTSQWKKSAEAWRNTWSPDASSPPRFCPSKIVLPHQTNRLTSVATAILLT